MASVPKSLGQEHGNDTRGVSQDLKTVHNSLKRLAASLDLQFGLARDFANLEVKTPGDGQAPARQV